MCRHESECVYACVCACVCVCGQGRVCTGCRKMSFFYLVFAIVLITSARKVNQAPVSRLIPMYTLSSVLCVMGIVSNELIFE